MFLSDAARTKDILALGIPIQVTNDPRYYPTTVPKIDHELVLYEHSLRRLTLIIEARHGQTYLGEQLEAI